MNNIHIHIHSVFETFQMENIGNFLAFGDQLGVPTTDSFQTVDLYESQNIPKVSRNHFLKLSEGSDKQKELLCSMNSIIGFLRL